MAKAEAPPQMPPKEEEPFPQKVLILSPPSKSPPAAEVRSAEEKERVEKETSGPPPLSPEERLRGLLTRAEALRAEGRCGEALDLYRQYLEKRSVPEVMNNYAACLWLVGRTEEAENWFRKSLSLKEDAEVRLNLVLLALARGDRKGACQELKHLAAEKLSASSLEIYQRLENRITCEP